MDNFRNTHLSNTRSLVRRPALLVGMLALTAMIGACRDEEEECASPDCEIVEALSVEAMDSGEQDRAATTKGLPFDVMSVVRQVEAARAPDTTQNLDNAPCLPGMPGCTKIGGSGDEGIVPPDVFFGNDIFVVSWGSIREGVGTVLTTRVRLDGTVMDPMGIKVGACNAPSPMVRETASSACSTALGFDGVNFLVTWEDARTGTSQIFANRLSPSGRLLSPTPIPVSTRGWRQASPAVACGVESCLVTWSDDRSETSSDIYGARMRDGVVLDRTGLPLAVGAGDALSPAVTLGGERFLVAYELVDSAAQSDILGVQVDMAGNVSRPFTVANGKGDQASPAVSYGEGRYLVAYDDHLEGQADVHVKLLAGDGSVLTGRPVATGVTWQARPAVAFDGRTFVVVWADDYTEGMTGIFAAQLDASAVIVDTATISKSALADTAPAVAFGSDRYLVAFTIEDDNGAGIYGNFVTP